MDSQVQDALPAQLSPSPVLVASYASLTTPSPVLAPLDVHVQCVPDTPSSHAHDATSQVMPLAIDAVQVTPLTDAAYQVLLVQYQAVVVRGAALSLKASDGEVTLVSISLALKQGIRKYRSSLKFTDWHLHPLANIKLFFGTELGVLLAQEGRIELGWHELWRVRASDLVVKEEDPGEVLCAEVDR